MYRLRKIPGQNVVKTVVVNGHGMPIDYDLECGGTKYSIHINRMGEYKDAIFTIFTKDWRSFVIVSHISHYHLGLQQCFCPGHRARTQHGGC